MQGRKRRGWDIVGATGKVLVATAEGRADPCEVIKAGGGAHSEVIGQIFWTGRAVRRIDGISGVDWICNKKTGIRGTVFQRKLGKKYFRKF